MKMAQDSTGKFTALGALALALVLLLLGTMSGWLGRQIQAKRQDPASSSSSALDPDSSAPAQRAKAPTKKVEGEQAEARQLLSSPEDSQQDAQAHEPRVAPATNIPITEYHANKSIKAIGSRLGVDGPCVGPWQFFREDGTLHQSGTYDSVGNETVVGIWTVFDDSGLKVRYEIGGEEGGTLVNTYNPETGEPLITSIPLLLPDGSPSKYGIRTIWHSFNDNIRSMESAYNDEGQKHGEWRRWHPNGQLEFQGTYADGQEIGAFVWYDQAGNLIKSESNE